MWTIFALPWVRKLGEFALLLAALAAVGFHIYHAGRRDGAREESGKQTETAHEQFNQIEKTFQGQLAAGQVREAQLSQLAQKFADLAAAAANRVDTARHISEVDAAKVKALPDSEVKADLELKAGGPLENPAVLRHVDDIFTDYPHKVEEAKAAEEGLAAVNSRVDALTASIANVAGERDAAIGAFNQLVPLYTQAYNAAIVGHRRWYCAFLCKPKNVTRLPDPISLTGTLKKGIMK
jgi:pyruvate/2-oxoglutarate dehydrogenase complex dihydrolipoamide acyltransferase (E2) component